MNYYEHWLGDYRKKTGRLGMAEHGAYRLMLDEYYANELPLPAPFDELYVICRAISRPDQVIVRKVADIFFPVGEDGFRHNARADEEIGKARPRIDAARLNGRGGGRPRNETKTQGDIPEKPNGFPRRNPLAGPPATHAGGSSPIPTPHTPEVQEHENGKATPLSGKPDRAGDVHTVFEHWRAVLGHQNAKLDEKRRKAVRQRLADGYTVEQLCAAVDGCARSAWHMGENDRGRRFDDLEMICRDSKHVDDFLRTTGPASMGLSVPGRQTGANLTEWVEEAEARDAARG